MRWLFAIICVVALPAQAQFSTPQAGVAVMSSSMLGRPALGSIVSPSAGSGGGGGGDPMPAALARWDADDVDGLGNASISNMDPVALWVEFGGDATRNLEQPASTDRPTFLINAGPGGTGATVQCDGVDDFMCTDVDGLISGHPFTVCHVIGFNGVVGTQNIHEDGAAGTPRTFKANNDSLRSNAGSTIQSSGSLVAVGWHMVCVEYNGASSLSRWDGVQVASGNTGADTLDGFCLCARNDGASPSDVDVSATWVNTGADSATFEAWAVAKYGAFPQ